MEKLELKHLAPYLPFKVKGVVTDKIQEGWLPPNSKVTLIIRYIDIFDGVKIKPILRPLSDLTKEEGLKISSNGIFYKDDGFMIWSKSNDCYTRLNAMQTPYWFNLLMLEHHFDVFGLIEKGSAIDINTLKK